jgi:hypothetical protein
MSRLENTQPLKPSWATRLIVQEAVLNGNHRKHWITDNNPGKHHDMPKPSHSSKGKARWDFTYKGLSS